ncbi:MAG: Tad domain-containing protein [Bryobacterales bacterium]
MQTNGPNGLRRPRSKGQVIVLIAIMSTFLIGLAGIAVDLVLVYSVKTFLSTATDSAAMGGARALERGVTYSDQAAEIERVTDMLFDANFPDGLMLTGSTGQLTQNVVVAAANMDPLAGPNFLQDPDMTPGMREIRVHSEALSPTMFMRVLA